MRSFIPTLVLVACGSDQEFHTITKTETVPVTNTNQVTETVTITNTITNTVTVTVPVDEPEVQCGFTHSGFPNDGLYTETNVTVTLLSPTIFQVFPGTAVDYTLEITNEDCDWATVDFIDFALTARGNNPWIETLEVEDPLMTLDFPLSNESYEGAGYNVSAQGYGEQLFYQFREDVRSPIDVFMEPQWIAPGDSIIANFTFDGSYALTSGESYELFVDYVGWHDIATGTHIMTSTYPLLTQTVTMF